MESVSIPFYAEANTLPASLPTLVEIEAAQEVLSSKLRQSVVGVGEHFVVKHGFGVDLLEGQTLLFLHKHTTLPVPRVYAFYEDRSTKMNYIIMERIHGKDLSTEWTRLNEEQKEMISSKLSVVLRDMRAVKSPAAYCAVGRRGLPDDLFWSNDPAQPFAGPFEDEDELNKAMLANYRANGRSEQRAGFFRRAFNEVFQSHPPCFTHGDFQRKNIMIRGGGVLDGGDISKDDLQIVLIDWEFAGWYPTYWEYARAIYACGHWTDDWNVWIDRVLEPRWTEYAWMHLFLHEMWF